MKSQWFSDARRAEFARLVHDADRHQRSYEVFGTFLDMASLALRQGVNRALLRDPDSNIEHEYLKAVKRVKHPDKIAHAMAVMVMALEENQYDFLGTVMSEWGMADKNFAGQCFTPRDLCNVSAMLTLGEDITPISNHRFLISEPACGGGAMVIAAAKHLKDRNFFPWNYWVHAVDIDRRCVQMAYIQLTFLGIPAVVSHGNTISQKMWGHWPTLTAALYPLREEHVEADEGDCSPAPAAEVVKPTGQLTLF